MERDLSLIEISGEDDSLLGLQQQQISNNEVFSCSPLLHFPRSKPSLHASPIESLNGNKGMCKPSSLLCKDGEEMIDKENVNLSKIEDPKLGSKPQQMKRKKKGGYNLRKSLAWDRAFFTEEGVLDPVELSMLSGNLGKSGAETLSVIHEGRESLLDELDSASGADSQDLPALESNLLKELPASITNEGKKIANNSSPKPTSSAKNKAGLASLAKRKVLSSNDINRSASKRSSCPRPIASSSLKKPPNVNTTKVAAKDSKVSKVLAPKPNSSLVSSATRSSIPSTSNMKRNQIAWTADYAQKSIGLMGTSKSTKGAQSDKRSGPSCKVTAQPAVRQARRNVRAHVSQTNNGAGVLPAPVLPSTTHPSNCHDASTGRIAVSFSPETQPQIAKPSGLRMPSPKMGFFDQSKPSGLNNLLQRSTQPCNIPQSSIPSLNKVGALNSVHPRPPRPPGKLPACSSNGSSSASTVNIPSHEKTKSSLELNSMQKIEQPHTSKSCNTINFQRQLRSAHDSIGSQSIDSAEPQKIAMIPHIESTSFESKSSKSPLQSGPSEGWTKDDKNERGVDTCPRSKSLSGVGLDDPNFTSHFSLPVEIEHLSEVNGMIADQLAKGEQSNPCSKNLSVSLVSQALGMNRDKTTSIGHDVQLSSMHEIAEQPGEQTELLKPNTCAVDVVLDSKGQNTGNLFEGSESSEELNNDNNLKAPDTSPKSQDSSTHELETSYDPSHFEKAQHIRNDANDTDSSNKKLVKNTQLQFVDDLLIGSGKSFFSALTADDEEGMTIDDLSEKSAEENEFSNTCLATKHYLQGSNGLHSESCLFNGKKFSSEEYREENIIQDVKSVESERLDVYEGESSSSKFCCLIPSVKLDSGFEGAGNGESLQVENVLTASPEPFAGYLRHDHDFQSKGTSLELEMGKGISLELEMGKGIVTGPTTTCEVRNVHPNGEDVGGILLENPHNMHVEVASTVNEMTEGEDVLDKQHGYLDKNSIALSDLHSGNDMCYNERGTSEPDNYCSESTHDVKTQYKGSTADVNETVSEGRSSLFQCQMTERATELPAVDNKKEALIEDAKLEYLDGNSLSDSCHSCIGALAANRNSVMVVNDICEQPEAHTVSQNSDIEVKQFHLENHELCSDDNLILNFSVQSQEKKASMEGLVVVEQCNTCSFESGSYDGSILHPPEVQDVYMDMEKDAEHPATNETMTTILKIEPSIESILDGEYRNAYELSDPAGTSEFDPHSRKIGDQNLLTGNACNSKPLCYLNDKLDFVVAADEISSGTIVQNTEVELSESNTLTEEVEAIILKNSSTLDSEQQWEVNNIIHVTKDAEAKLSPEKPVSDKKQDALAIKPPPNAAPFSDEWLSAFEAAGEEILTMKGGAVQNSPPDKSQPEPGPWSPVKRKNNQGIGPFDCTKFTNNMPPSTTE